MKLYLAISSLNIDNILSTESVAPFSFYNARKYGYNSFYGLEAIPYRNILILFSMIPHFEIYDREHDNRPVVLEINVNEKINPLNYIDEHEGIKIYSTDTILRLSPFNTRILFFNLNDLNLARLSCSDSLTNKLGDRFRFELCKAEFDLAHLSNLNLHVDDICNGFEQKALLDNRLNTIKGFVFGYYLGISKSVSPYSAILLKIQKRIYDIVATIRNSGDYGNNTFYEELEQLDKEYRKNDPNTRLCRELWDKTLKELAIPSESLDKLLEIYDEKSVLKFTFMKKNGLQPPISLRQYGYNNLEAYRDNINTHTSTIVKKDQQEQLSVFDVNNTFDLDPSYETCMLAGEDSVSMLFNKFIDAVLWHGIAPTPDTLRTDRFNIATQITIVAKNIWESLHQDWQDSSAQIFMNELRQNIKSFTPFDVNKQDNIILKSIAAFVLKGEDYDSIVQFCEDNSYADYRYALALWGATQGYVKITKPIMSHLSNRPSFSNSYKAILTLLYNIDSEGDLPNIQDVVTIYDKTENKQPYKHISVEVGNEVQVWQNGIRSYLDQLKNVPKKKELYAPLESAFIENGDQMDYVKFFALLNDFKEWKTAKGEPIKAWKSMVEHFCPEEYACRFGEKSENVSETKKQRTIVQKTLDFLGLSEESEDIHVNNDEPTHQIVIEKYQNKTFYKSSLFVSDKHCWDFIKSFVPEKLHKEVYKDLKWFQDEYEKGDASQYYARASRENQATIEAFIRYLGKKKYANSLNTQSIGDYLRKVYVR